MDRTTEAAAQQFFNFLWGERFDWTNQHYEGTPARFAKMLKELTHREEFKFTKFRSNSDELVIIKDIPFVSLCAHHIVPYMGRAHVGYIPKGQIAGLSKFARLVKYYAADLTVQEELTYEIGRRLDVELMPQGVGVIMEAEHLCMTIRGVQTPGAKTKTSFMSGVFLDHDRQARSEFLSLVGSNHG